MRKILKNIIPYLPSCVLVALFGVNVAFCIKNRIKLSELKASDSNNDSVNVQLSGYLKKYYVGSMVSTSLYIDVWPDTYINISGVQSFVSSNWANIYVSQSLVSMYKMDCMSNMGCYASCSSID